MELQILSNHEFFKTNKSGIWEDNLNLFSMFYSIWFENCMCLDAFGFTVNISFINSDMA